jgi:hypothetical protein
MGLEIKKKCPACHSTFECVQVTFPPRFCPTCRAIRKKRSDMLAKRRSRARLTGKVVPYLNTKGVPIR